MPVTPSEISRTAKAPDHVLIQTDDGAHVEVTDAVAVGCEWPQSPCSVVGRLGDESSGAIGPLYEGAGRDVRVPIVPERATVG